MLSMLVKTFKKAFDFRGRATRKEFWSYVIASYFAMLLLLFMCIMLMGIMESSPVAIVLASILMLLGVAILFPSIALTVRRLHDVGLSGFWLLYLNPAGIALVFVVYLLCLDKSVENIIERVKSVGSPWLGCLLTIPAWICASSATLFLIALFQGQQKDNEYGPNPYID